MLPIDIGTWTKVISFKHDGSFHRCWDKTCFIGFDIDAGPIIFGLGPSGTAFMAGSSTYFGDDNVRKEILTTAEIAGQTIKIGEKRHYLLANIALVGESIMLAMRTNIKR